MAGHAKKNNLLPHPHAPWSCAASSNRLLTRKIRIDDRRYPYRDLRQSGEGKTRTSSGFARCSVVSACEGSNYDLLAQPRAVSCATRRAQARAMPRGSRTPRCVRLARIKPRASSVKRYNDMRPSRWSSASLVKKAKKSSENLTPK